MKKFINSIAVVMLLALSVVVLDSCSDSDPIPSDVITDDSGIKADLEWSIAGGTTLEAKEAADLDLELYDSDDDLINYSWSLSQFENIQIEPSLADGTYTLAVYLDDTTKDVSYVVTVNGQSVSKPIKFNSTFEADDANHRVDVLKITKAGSKYTVREL